MTLKLKQKAYNLGHSLSLLGKIYFIILALVLKKGILFCKKIQLTYPQREMEGSLLEQRPDLYLGRFLSMFADFVFGQYANLDDTDGRYTFHQHVYDSFCKCKFSHA